MVQQQALRDFTQAMANFFAGTHRRPTWRKAGRDEGFRVVAVKPGHVPGSAATPARPGSPKPGGCSSAGPAPPDGMKSYRVTRDRAGRWHIAFAAIPAAIPAPGNGTTVGVDRGIAVSAALSTGQMLTVPRAGLARRRMLAAFSANWPALSAARTAASE